MSPRPAEPRLVPIEELNQLPPARFAAALAPLFEAAAPLADELSEQRPYDSYDELLGRAEAIVARLPIEQKITVINAHPRIGAAAESLRRTSPLSYREQGYDQGAPVDSTQRAGFDQRLAELNRAYEARFGFRFVVFVNRRPRTEIVEVIEARLERSRDEEMQTALSDMLAIARDRLATLQGPTDMR